VAQKRIGKRSVAVVSLFLVVALGVFVLEPAIAYAFDACLPMNQLGEKPDGDPDLPSGYTDKSNDSQQTDNDMSVRFLVDALLSATAHLVF